MKNENKEERKKERSNSNGNRKSFFCESMFHVCADKKDFSSFSPCWILGHFNSEGPPRLFVLFSNFLRGLCRHKKCKWLPGAILRNSIILRSADGPTIDGIFFVRLMTCEDEEIGFVDLFKFTKVRRNLYSIGSSLLGLTFEWFYWMAAGWNFPDTKTKCERRC